MLALNNITLFVYDIKYHSITRPYSLVVIYHVNVKFSEAVLFMFWKDLNKLYFNKNVIRPTPVSL